MPGRSCLVWAWSLGSREKAAGSVSRTARLYGHLEVDESDGTLTWLGLNPMML